MITIIVKVIEEDQAEVFRLVFLCNRKCSFVHYWRGDRNIRIYGLEGNDYQGDIGKMAVFRCL